MSYKIDKIISEELLRNLFSMFGEVCDTTIKQVSVDRVSYNCSLDIVYISSYIHHLSFVICSQKSHRLKGYGFVSFRNDEGGLCAAERALAELNEATIDEVTFKCEVSHILDTPPPQAPGYGGHPAGMHHSGGVGGDLDYELQLQQQNSYFDDYHNGFAGAMGETGLYMGGHSGAGRTYESLYEQQQPLHSSGQASPAVLGGILPTSGKYSAYTSREVSPINSHGDICGILTDDIHNPFAFRGSGSGQPSPTNHHSMAGPGSGSMGSIGMGIGMGGGSKVISPTAAAFKSTPSSAAGGSPGTLYASQQSLAGKQQQQQMGGMNNIHGVPRPPYHQQQQQFHPSAQNHYPQQHREGSYGPAGYGLHHHHSAPDNSMHAHFEPQPPGGMRRAYSAGSPHISSSSPQQQQQYWQQQSPLQQPSPQQQYPLHGAGEFGRNRYSPNSGYSSLQQQPHISQKQPYQQQRGSAGVYGAAGFMPPAGPGGAAQGLYGAAPRPVQQPMYARGALQQRHHSSLPFAPQSYDLDIPGAPSAAATSPPSGLSRPPCPVSAPSRGGLYGDLSLNGLLGTPQQQQAVLNSGETTVSSSSDTLSLQCLGLGSVSADAFSILPGISRSISSTSSSMFVHQSSIGKSVPSLALGISSAPSMDLVNSSSDVTAIALESSLSGGAGTGRTEATTASSQQQQQQEPSWLSAPYELPQM